jgi:hypothetical protein
MNSHHRNPDNLAFGKSQSFVPGRYRLPEVGHIPQLAQLLVCQKRQRRSIGLGHKFPTVFQASFSEAFAE